ncbi:Tagatose-6-phosphate kinase [compost metagenome]
MIVTVTLNPAIDKRLHVPALKVGAVQRTSAQESTAGGKGLNVSRVVQQLGEKVLATGFLGGMNGEWIKQRLDRDGIQHDFVAVNGETRICLNIIDDASGTSTEILEQGPQVTEKETADLLNKIRQLAAPDVWFLISGSLPSGISRDIYAVIIREAQARGAKVVLDTSGPALLEGIQAGPYAIKPNQDEILQLTGETSFDEQSFANMMPKLAEQGINHVIVSMGAEGSIASFDGILYRVKAPRIQAVNAVGSGDSFVAGLAVAWERGWSGAEALRLATAAGAANAYSPGTGDVKLQDVERMMTEVQVIEL